MTKALYRIRTPPGSPSPLWWPYHITRISGVSTGSISWPSSHFKMIAKAAQQQKQQQQKKKSRFHLTCHTFRPPWGSSTCAEPQCIASSRSCLYHSNSPAWQPGKVMFTATVKDPHSAIKCRIGGHFYSHFTWNDFPQTELYQILSSVWAYGT